METLNPQHLHKSDDKDEIVNCQDIEREAQFSIPKQDALSLLAMGSLSLMAALDGTSISVALPVFIQSISHQKQKKGFITDVT
jgi:hypothetical protein